jgi:hypothetical protein
LAALLFSALGGIRLWSIARRNGSKRLGNVQVVVPPMRSAKVSASFFRRQLGDVHRNPPRLFADYTCKKKGAGAMAGPPENEISSGPGLAGALFVTGWPLDRALHNAGTQQLKKMERTAESL